jgi:hypothetical protein
VQLDLGDIVLALDLRVKRFSDVQLVWVIGPVGKATAEDRQNAGPRPQYLQPPGKVDLYMNLKADQKVGFELTGKDEMGNDADMAGATLTFTVDDPSVATVTDNGDGTGEVAAVGPLGSTILNATGSLPSGQALSGTVAIDVVAGDVASVDFAFGEPEEVTPDEA